MAREGQQDYRETEAELRKRVEGEVRFDHYSRLLYATDASIYQMEPVGVVIPRHKGPCWPVAAAPRWRDRPWATPSSWTSPST